VFKLQIFIPYGIEKQFSRKTERMRKREKKMEDTWL